MEAALERAAPEVSAEARTLVEMTFLDHVARRSGLPVCRIVGLPEPALVQLLQTVPVGERPPQTGPLKVKLGGPDDAAILRDLAALRRWAGKRGPLVIDLNRGWTRGRLDIDGRACRPSRAGRSGGSGGGPRPPA